MFFPLKWTLLWHSYSRPILGATGMLVFEHPKCVSKYNTSSARRKWSCSGATIATPAQLQHSSTSLVSRLRAASPFVCLSVWLRASLPVIPPQAMGDSTLSPWGPCTCAGGLAFLVCDLLPDQACSLPNLQVQFSFLMREFQLARNAVRGEIGLDLEGKTKKSRNKTS